MARIDVNHKLLREVASAIAEYCSAQDREMRSADTEIQAMLISDWIGTDAEQFKQKWAGVNTDGSTTAKFRESLKNYGENLIACADEYEKAQGEAYDRASRLPKVLYW